MKGKMDGRMDVMIVGVGMQVVMWVVVPVALWRGFDGPLVKYPSFWDVPVGVVVGAVLGVVVSTVLVVAKI